MASFSDLRPRARSAKAGTTAVRSVRSPKLLLAVSAALLLTAFFAVSELATLRGAKAHDASAYLTRELGSPLSSSSLVGAPARTSPALGGKLQIRRGGLKITSAHDTLTLRFKGSAPWRQFSNGVARPTAFGREAITFGVNRVEQSLLVERHVGTRAWTWNLRSNLDPRIARDGSVRFGHSNLRILPVAILDIHGRDVTPSGLRWSLRRDALVLRLHDADLPARYIIDPIALVAACPGGGCSSAVTSNGTMLTLTRPGSVATGNLMVAQVVLHSNAAITAPAGWSTIGSLQTSGSGLEQQIYYKVATAGDTAGTTYQWSWSGAADAAGGILAYSGVDGTSPFDVTPSNNSGTSTTATASSVTTTQNNDMLIAFYGVQGQTGSPLTVTQDTGQAVTQDWAAASGSTPSSRVYANAADGAQAAAGATGSKTATASASAQWAAHLVTLMPPLAVDGAGTLVSSISNVSASQTGRTITFTYTAASGGMQNGSITLVVPAGWSAPSTTGANAGYTTASTGTVGVAGQTITVSNVTVAGGATMTITYGSAAGGGPGATATSSTGAQTWQAQQKARSAGTLTNLGASPSITVYAADGAGTMGASISAVSASQTGRTVTLTYTAPTGGISGGAVSVDVPTGWSAPSTTGSAAGYSTSSAGTLAVAGQTITVASLTLAAGNTFTITYGSTASGGPGATATSTTGAQNWTTKEKSTTNGTLTNIASQPSITVYAADGAGTLSPSTTAVSASATGRTLTFTYTAPTGGISSGTVTLVVPSGWSAPSTTGSAAGFTTASTGSVSVAGSTITVSSLTVAAGNTFTITYGSTASGGPGAGAPSSTGAQTWTTQEKSTSAGSLTDIAAQPGITIYAADGTGTMGASISAVSASQTGRTITFTYTAPAGGISNGSVTVAIPSGWSAPSTTSSAAGYTTASSGTVSVAGQTITVSSLTLAAANTFTITYGDTGSGGPGATIGSTTGAQSLTTQEKSTSGGTLTSIASSPSITVYAADGSGTMGASISAVSASQTGRTITFTYTAATGGISNGTVTLVVPSGWSAPSTTSSAAGYSTSSAGTLTVSSQTITVSSLTIAGGSTFTITYGDTSSGGPGAAATSTTGAQNWQTQEKSTSAGSLTDIAAQPSITVYAADGAGTMGASISGVSASQTGRTITFTYTAPTGGISNGTVTLVAPSGWSAPSTTGSAAGYSTSSAGTLTVSSQTITVSSLTLAAGNTFTITYGSTASAGPGATATATTGAQNWTTQEKSTSNGTLTNIAAQPSITVYAADGAGTMGASISAVSASQTGRTITFTYTAPTGGISNGTVTLVVPAGWNAPSTTAANAGYSTSSAGTLTVSSQTITVSSLTVAAGNTFTITYGDTGSGGPGATATSTTGAQNWTTQEKSTSNGSLSNIAAQPSITVYAADGTGTMGASIGAVSASQTGRTVTFTYTAAAGGISNGTVTLVVPSGWSAPSTTGSAAGYSTSSTGTLTVSSQTITVSSLTVAGGSTFTITYGDTGGGGPGATATSTTGAQTWTTQEKSTSNGSLSSIAAQPSITVYAADGTGTMGASISAVSASQTGRTITFTYTAPAGGTSNGSVTLAIPSGWSAPSTTGSAAGYSTSSAGTLSVAGSTITVSSLTLAAGNTFTITYGSTASAGPGATATASTGAQTWTTQEKSTSSGTLTSIASSPSVTVYAADGAGTMGASISAVSASQTGRTITFTYTAPGGGISNGSVTLAIPSGWSAPSTTSSAAGYSTSSAGTLSVAGSTITVSSLTVAAGNTFTITYGDNGSGGPGATATSTAGAQTWQVQEKSTSAGSLANLSSSPSITVYAADGTGTMGASISVVSASQTGRTITFTYTAPAGGISNGSVTLAIPSGWSAPSTTSSAAGYSTSSAGTLSVAGSTITVASVTLAAGNTFTITYGDTSSGGPGATATSTTGAQTWQVQEKSTSSGSLTNISSSPSITVYAADGAGTMGASISAVSASQTGRTITFTYTAPAGGISNGSVTLAVPSGWSAPSTTGSAAGYSTSSAGTLSVAGSTITVSSLTLAAGNTFTITYGNTGSGGPGATATSSTGAQTWTTQEKSTSSGTLTSIASSPSITVYAADGAGTLNADTSSVAVSSTGNTITFTYTAPAGGISSGSVTLAVPAGWSAPSTTGSAAGYSTSSAGTLTVAGSTITVSSLTLAAGNTFTIVYGSKGSGGPGATATSSSGAQTWQAQAKSTSAGSLANLGSSPSIAVLSSDGSGTLTTPTGAVNTSSTGNTITFTYTAATGGLANGSVTLAVPSGWSAPSTTGSVNGYTTASTGSVSVAGQTVTVSGVNLSGGSTFTITYGSTAGGGSGATAPGTAAAQTWQAQEKSSSGGTLTNLGSSPAITVNDPTAPSAPNLSVGSFTNASATGTTVYIRQGSAGGFTVTGTSNDPESGIDHLTFPNGLGSGWSGGGQDNSSPYTGAYTFTAAATAPGGNQNVTATNGWALTSSTTAFTVVADTTAPTVAAPSVTAGYYTSASVPVTVNTGSASDGGSGVDASTSILQSESGTLSAGTCTWSGTWNNVTLSGGNDTGVSSGSCYRYRELLSDKVGNQGTSAVSNVAKVDTSAPSTPSLAFSVLSANAYYDGSGTLYLRPSAGGTFTVTASSTDAQSGIAAYTFGTLNSNGGANFAGSQSGDHFDYTFNGTTTAPSTARTVGATNGAGTSATNATYSIAADTTAPSVTAPSVTAGYYTSLSVPVAKNGGSDGGAGVDSTTSILERDGTTLTNGTCGTFSGSWSTVTLTAGNDTSVLSGHCYEYREKLSDRVGNQGTSGASNVAKVDTQGPANSLSVSNLSPAGSALKVGSRVYYRGAVTGGGSFKLTNAVTDAESAPASSATAALGGTTSGWAHTPSTVSTPAGGPYDSNAFSWSQGTTSSPTEVVTAADGAGNTTAASTLTFTNDSNAPTGGALTVNGGATWSTTGSFNIDTRTDYSEAQSSTESGLASSTLTRAAASLTNNSCGTYGSPTTLVGTPAQSLATGCYLYTLTGTDNLGNTASVTSTVKVDTSDPSAPTFSFTNFTGTTSAVGNTVFFLPTSSGSFDVTPSSSDGDSGISGYTFPTAASFGSGWSVSGTGSTRTYSYTPGSATPGSQSVTATNNAGLTASSSFSVIVSDTSPPTTTIQCNGAACQAGYYASSPVSVTLSADDGPAGSGVKVIRYTLDGSDPSPINGSDYIGPIDIVATTTVKFRAYDNLDNEEAVGSKLVRVDANAPTGQTITLTGSNAPYYTSNSVTFTTGNGSDADSGLDLSSATVTRQTGDLSADSCSNFSADSGTFSSPDTAVSGGHCYRYSFTIADNVGHVSTAVTATAKVDTDNPSVSLTDPGTPVAGTISLSASASDASTAVQQVVFQRSPAGASTWTSIGTDTTAPYSASWNTGAVADGLYDLRAVATDILGHTHADLVANRRVDNTAPDTSIDNGPANPSNNATPTFAFSASEPGSTFECRIDGGSWSSCTSPDTTSALAAGSHTFDVRATDQAGNTDGTPATQTWTIDLTAPNTTIDSSPGSPSGNATPTFDFSSSESGSTFECRIDGGSWSSCTSPHTTAALTDGSHTFDVRATDQAGNTDATPATHTWTVDLTAPNTTLDSTPSSPSNDTTPTFDFSSSEGGSTFECRIDGGSWTSCTSPHTTASLGAGTHTFDVRATDAVGNTDGTPASFTWTIDLTAPNTTIDSGPANPSNNATPTFAFSASEPGSTFECRIDGGSWNSCTSPHTTSALGGGSHTFDVRATDQAGNTDGTPATQTWTIDLTAPNTTIDSGPADPSNDTTPAFSFSSSEGGSTFECRIDGGSWSSCTSPHTTSSLGAGSHTFDVRATDAAGNTDGTPASQTWTIDLTAPNTTLDSTPSSPSNDTTPTFDFSSSEAGSTFECRTDGGSWTSCTSPHTTAVLGAGTHTFDVRATDAAGNTDGTPASFTWTIDLTAPNTTIDNGPTNPTNDTTPTFAFSASEPGSTFECRIDGGSWNSCTSPHTTSALAEGSHTFDVRATDQAGNTDGTPASQTWTIDLTAPNTTIDSSPASPSGNATPTFDFSSSEPGSTFECRIDSGSWSSCTSPHTTAALTDGSHTFDVRATDQAGNTDATPASHTWTVDLTAPNTTLDSTPSSPSNDTTPTFDFSSSEAGSTFECRIDGGSWTSCSSPHTTGALAEGTHTFDVRATDVAGNRDATPASFTWTIDLTAPNTTIDSGPTNPTNDTTPTFAFSASEPGSTFECRVDGGSWNSCTSPHTTSALAEGSHTFDVRATDQAGNTDGTPASQTWTIDLTPPNTTIDSAPSSPSGNATPTFDFSSSEAGSTFECRIDSGSWSSCTSPHTTAALADGSHTFDVRATDQADNTDTTPASHTWTVDLTAPNTTIDSTPSSPSNDTTPTFDFSSSEAGSSFECRVDSGSWSSCTSPHTTGVLAEGTHTFDVRATDVAGNTDATPASFTWAIDLTAPNTTIDSGPSNPTNDTTPTFAFSASEPGSSFECRVDSGSWSSCTSPHTTAGLAEGSHTFDVRATDQAGNTDGTPASQTWTIDLTAPNTTIDSAPPALDNDPTPTFTFSSSESGSTFECRVDGSSWSSCTSPHTTASLADGSHTFDVRATDAAGNTDGTPASDTWTLDVGPPTVAITAPTTYINSSDPSTYSVTASTPDGDVTHVDFYECSNASVGCSSGTWIQFDTDNSAPFTGSWSTPGTDGKRALRAVAVDAALNTGEAVRTITIDRTPPSGVTVSYADGYAFGTVPVTTNNGSDPDVDASSAALERQTGDLSGDACTNFSSWGSVTSPDTVASGKCAKYRYRIADNAGNWTTATSSNVVKSDTNAPTSAQDDPGANLRGTITLTSSANDAGGSGLASVAFQRRPAGGGSWTTVGTDNTSPFSISYDTAAGTDGLYDFRTVATDKAGNTESSPVVVANRRIDNTAPSATMQSPGNPVRGTVGLTSNTSDGGSGIDTVTYELAPHGGSFTTQPASWDTTLGADGLYDLRVVATDLAGNSTTSPLVTTRVDNTPPALTFSSPATGATVSGTVSLTASSSDASPASPPISFFYKLHSDPPSAYTGTSASWNTTTLPAGDGLYDVRARTTDDAANTTTVENTSIRVDNVPPSVAITAPAPAINGSLPSPTSFSATAGDPGGSGVQQVQFFECSNQSNNCSTGVWSPLGTVAAPGPYTVSWNIPATDGNHALAAVATDNAGHASSDIRNVDVDRTAPQTTITSKPADPSNAATPSFAFSSSEAGSTFECRIDAGSWSPCTSPRSLSGLTDNAHTFDVRATDAAGNTDASPDSWTWHRDTTNPTGTLTSPGANIRQTVTLTSAESDPLSSGYASGVSSVSYEYSSDGSTWATIGTLSSAPFDSLLWNTTGVSDGIYQLRVVVHDVAGNSAPSAAVTNVRIDNTPPTTSQNDPGAYLRATKTLSGSAADFGSGVDHVDFQQAPAGSGSWTTIATATTSPYSVSFDTTSVPDGHYDFRTVAYDVAGNQAPSAAVGNRLVDNTPPTATLNDPGAYLRGAVGLSSSTGDPGGANASGIASVAYEYSTNGGTTWQPTGSTFDSTSVGDGNVALHVVATDAAGNTTTSSPVTKLVDNTKPSTSDDAPGGWHASAVTVHLTGNDAGSGVNVTEYSVDGNPTYTVGTSVVIPAPSDGSNDGSHTIAYFSVDNAGNIETVKSATVLIDATPPACPSCSAADYLRGSVTLSASPAADGSGIKSVAFEYSVAGAGVWTTIGTDTTGPAPYTADWDTTAVPDGHYDLRIVITDNADNATTSDLPDKVVDNTAPNVATVGAPTEGQIVTGSVGISATASDATSPIASVEFFVRGSSLGTDTTAPFSLNWNTTSGSDGPATIQIVVTDMAGNSTTSAVRNVTVDNVAPTPTLADPGQNLSGTVSLSASSDPDTTQVDFERRPAGGGSWTTIASDTSTPWGTSLDTNTLTDGLYDFRAVATDGTGHIGTSPLRANVRVDNTAPSGSVTAPAAGATVGGTSVTLSSSDSDGGSGVASVSYELRPTGGGSFAQIASSSSAPFSATWNATTVSSGSYDLRAVISDRAGNTFTSAVVTFTVDVTAPTVTLTNPGATISGVVTLNATVSGSGATNVVFAATPAGGATWTSLGTDTSAPWSIAYDTTKLADGVYDLRATVSDNLGNSSQDVVTGVRVDNAAPQLVSSSPAEGSTIGSATAISLVTSEPATPVGVTLDGGATVAPVISGTHIDYNTGALAAGPHTLAGELQDSSGKRTPFRVHFTVGSSGPVEKNTSSTSPTTATSSDGFGSVTVPAGAWSSSSDWLVVRITPTAAPSGLTNGFGPGPEALDVTAYWALSGVQVHEFSQPLEVVIHSTASGLVPATYDGSAWRVIHRVPTGGALPAGWVDGFFTASDGIHILTKHLSLFALLKDLQAPQTPQNIRGYVGPDGLTIRWLPGSDNSGTYDYVTVFAGSSDTGHYGPDYTAATIAGWKPGDTRIIRLQETDLAGNTSELSAPLEQLPSLVGMTVEQARAALAARGISIGSVTVGGIGKPGTVTGPEGLALAPQGSAIDVTVAGGASTSLVFKVVTAPKLKPTKRTTMAARVLVTRAAHVSAQLISPRHVRLYTWRFKVRAGRTILKLRIPRQVRRPGIYTLRWTARAGRETATRMVRFRLVGKRAPVQKIQIVLAGTAATGVGGNLKQKPTVVTSADPAFDAAANRSRDVRVVVVDADELGVPTVHDLHVVFPSVKIIALAAGPKTMAAALRAGATIVLPRTTPPATLATIIQRLAKRK